MATRWTPGTIVLAALLGGVLLTLIVSWTHAFLRPERPVVGWPAPAMAYEAETFNDAGFPVTRERSWRVMRRHPLGGPAGGGLVLPLHPLWPGYAIDALILAAFGAGALLVPGLTVRQVRLARGRCPACGYPIGDDSRCSECGLAIPPRSGDRPPTRGRR